MVTHASTAGDVDDGDLVFPTSYAQQRMWFLHQLDPTSSVYVSARVVRLQGPLDVAALERALNEVVARHEALRTRFSVVDGAPVQVVLPELTVRIELALAEDAQVDEIENHPALREVLQKARRPFDLATAPLLRVQLLRVHATDHVAVFCFHHIVVDGWSIAIFDRELSAAYRSCTSGRPLMLDPLPVQYADYADWQQSPERIEALAKDLAYWRGLLDGVCPVLEIPGDRPRARVQSFRGSRFYFQLSAEETSALRALGRREGVTLFMTLLAAFATLLHRYTGRDDLLVGSPIANRSRAEIEGLIGLFVNTLALRVDLSRDPSFRTLLGRIRTTCKGAYGHQDVPFEKLVDEVRVERDPSRNPLVQVFFALQNPPRQELDLPGVRITPVEFERWSARFDLELHFWEHADFLSGAFVYATDLFEFATIEQLFAHLRVVLAELVRDPAQRIGAVELLSRAERAALIGPPGVGRDASAATIGARFAGRAAATPQAIAISSGAESLTYQALDERSDQLAHHLRDLRLPSEAAVAVFAGPGIAEVVAMLAIWKAGYACLPLDPSEPIALIRDAIEQCRIQAVVTCGEPFPSQARPRTPFTAIDLEMIDLPAETGAPAIALDGRSAALILRALGGWACLEHGALCDQAAWLQRAFALTASDVVRHDAAASLTAIVGELLWPLLHGAGVAASAPGTIVFLSPEALARGAQPLVGVRLALCTGGPLTQDPGELACSVVHLYGLPETSGYAALRSSGSTAWQPNCAVYVLDDRQQLLPIGVYGEIYLGGTGLARGYVDAAPATAARFVSVTLGDRTERLVRTGERGRRLRDGRIELQVAMAWQDGHQVAPSAIAAHVMRDPAVRDCVVLPRATEAGTIDWLAYAVAAAPIAREALLARLRDHVPAACLPRAIVSLTGLPRTAWGEVDRPALAKFAVIDDELACRWQHELARLDGVSEVAVAIQEAAPRDDQPSLYRRTWQRKEHAHPAPLPFGSDVLVFAADDALGRALCTRLRERGQRVVCVEAGGDYHRASPDRYRIAPDDAAHHARLVESLWSGGYRPASIVHLWTRGAPDAELGAAAVRDAQRIGLHSLLCLVQAIAAKRGDRHRVTLTVIGSHVQAVDAGDSVAVERTPLLGLIRSLPHELPWLACRHIDLPATDDDVIDALLRELDTPTSDCEIALRNGARFVPVLVRIEGAAGADRSGFDRGGLYLISGGFGDIGSALARYLVERHAARVLLIGRTSLAQPWCATAYDRVCAGLPRGSIMYVAADVCEPEQVTAAVAAAEAGFATGLCGIVHVAGEHDETAVLESSADRIAHTLAPRIVGACVLAEFVRARPGALFVAFSSARAALGAPMAATDAAAACFFEAFAQHLRSVARLAAHSLAWSMWDQTGTRHDDASNEHARDQGYVPLATSDALEALERALRRDEHHLLIGLDASKPWVRSRVAGVARPVERLVAFVSPASYQPGEVAVADRYGTSSVCEVIPLEHLPRTAAGEIDHDQLALRTSVAGDGERSAPRTALERVIAQAWCEVLRVSYVGVRDNFFDLGGNSMKMTQVLAKLDGSLPRAISVVDLFQHPTVGSLARFLTAGGDASSAERGKRRAQSRREAQAQRRRR